LLLLLVILPFWINLLIRTYALIAVFRTRGTLNFTLEWLWNLAVPGQACSARSSRWNCSITTAR
jgi:ABC-type spermidine/putrescine transport system permease subunit I